MNVESGIIKLRRSLKGLPDKFVLIVEAKDVTRKEMTSRTTATIKVGPTLDS